ncbi:MULTISPECIES: hypothetical protein [Psychrobacter]|uniref:hypothetical protein n=1 Tax=Psychrobacter TaxID=497 RepID=UPI00146A50A1|nr:MULTISPECIES: hypothetical protein [Psychrobacter]
MSIASSTTCHAPPNADDQKLRNLTKDIVKLFGEWQLNFGRKACAKDYPVQKAILWARVVMHLNPTAEEWQVAKARSIFEEWPPSSARDLLALASVRSDYPDLRDAYKAATQGLYAHDVVFETARRLGFWDLKSKAESITYPIWQSLYPKVCREHASGAEFKTPKSRQLTYEHMPMSADSPMAEKVDTFLNEFKRKWS